MALRGADQFSFILTSDGSMDSYPDNKTSAFRVQLKNPIEIGDEDWEVALMSINYPYSWTNIGPSAKVYMKYYVDPKIGVKVVNFPNWQCRSIDEVVSFMMVEMRNSDAKVYFGTDELGRFKVSGPSSTFDIGFSNELLKLLGLAGHTKAEYMTIEAFNKRENMRQKLYKIWVDDNPFDFRDEELKDMIRESENLLECTRVLSPFLELTKILKYFDFLESSGEISPVYEGRGTWERFKEIESLSDIIDDRETSAENFEASQVGQGMRVVVNHLQYLIENMCVPSSFKGITPCNLNPVQRMFIYMNIIEAIDMNDKAVKLLKMVNTRGESFKTTQEDFSVPTYVPIEKGTLSRLEVLIASESGDPVSFQSGTVVLTLHFKRVSRTKNFRRF